MADVRTNVEAVISVVDQATPAIEGIARSLEGVSEVAKKVRSDTARDLDALLDRVGKGARSLEEIQKDIPRSVEEQRRLYESMGALKAPPWAKVRGEDVAPAVAPALEQQVEEVKAVVAKLDQPIAGIGDKLRASLSKTFLGVGTRVGTLGNQIRTNLGGAFSGVSGAVERMGASIKTFFTGIGGFLTGALVVGAIKRITAGLDEFAKQAQRLGEQARGLGVTVEELQYLQRWARDANLPVGTMKKNLGRLNRTIGQVAAGKNKKAGELFEELGVAITDPEGKIRPFLDILRDTAEAVSKMPDAARQSAVGFQLLGQNYAGMVDAMRGGAADIDRAIAAQEKAGVVTGAQVEQVAEYQRAVRGIAEQWRGLQTDIRSAIGEVAMPVVTPVLTELETWLSTNREWLKENVLKPSVEGLATAFKALADYVKASRQEFESFSTWIEPLATKLDELRQKLQLPEVSMPKDLWGTGLTAMRDDLYGFLADAKGVFGRLGFENLPLEQFRTLGKRLGTAIAETGFEAGKAFFARFAEAAQELITGLPGKIAGAFKQGLWGGGAAAAAPPALPAGTVGAGAGGLLGGMLGGPKAGDLVTAAAAGQPAQGTVNVTIENKNPPPGTRTTARAAGTGVTADVGQSMPWSAPAYSGPWAPAPA